MSCENHIDRLLLAPLAELCHGCIASAISEAEEMGRMKAFGDDRIVQGFRSKEFFAEPLDYWTAVIVPNQKSGELSPEEFERWEADFDSGRMSRDPRVQAFCGQWARSAAELVSIFHMRRMVVATIAHADPEEVDEIQPVGLVSGVLPVFSFMGQKYCVAFHHEVRPIVETHIISGLPFMETEFLLPMTLMPEGSAHILNQLQDFGEDAEAALHALVADPDDLYDFIVEEEGLSSILTQGETVDAEVLGTDEFLILRWPDDEL